MKRVETITDSGIPPGTKKNLCIVSQRINIVRYGGKRRLGQRYLERISESVSDADLRATQMSNKKK